MNIRIQMINPGFVETPLTKNNKFAMPALMSVGHASERIAYGLKTGGFEVAFPRRLTIFLKLINLFPYPLYFWFVNWAMGLRKRSSRKRKRPGR
jgi:short-subunit dehydrogenase